jgi:FKBP-type peptidyl-prolyl cis-trans isomerase SlpA
VRYKINYKLTTSTGALVDEAQDFTFEAGDGSLTFELEQCITTSDRDELQTILLQGSDVFGAYTQEGLTHIPKTQLPQDISLNGAIDFILPNGDVTIGVVKEIYEDNVLIDFNHPLSQCGIAFQFEILEKFQ